MRDKAPTPASARVTFATSIKTVFTNSILALLFCIIFFQTLAMAPSIHWSRSSTAMSYMSVSMDGLALVGQRFGRGAGRRPRAPLAAASSASNLLVASCPWA
ncbi:MAG: hypothetical protein ACLU37_13185 [Collinsella sp.]